MNTKPTETTEVRQGDLDDAAGTYTIDDGHPGSYNHEAVVSVGEGAIVTVTCTCGEWKQTGEVRFGDDGDTAVLAAWEAHVHEATGRKAPKSEADRCMAEGCMKHEDGTGSGYCSYECFAKCEEDVYCEAPVGVTLAVMSGLDIVFLWSCLQHADEWATTLESEFGMAPERAARLTPTALCGHQGRQSLVSVAVDSVEYAVEVDMDAVRAFNQGGAR